jgi:hypothetical protein
MSRPQYRTTIVLGLIVFALEALGGGAPISREVEDQPAHLLEHVVWSPSDPHSPVFVSAQVLGEMAATPDGLATVGGLDEYLRLLRFSQKNPNRPECNSTSESSFSDQESPSGRSMIELLEPIGFSAKGIVRAVVPGWALRQPMTTFYVEVEEIISCTLSSGEVRKVGVGDLVSTSVAVGGFELHGIKLCSQTPEEYHVPMLGDEVIIAGRPQAGDSYYLGPLGVVLVLDGETVLPQPYADFQWRPRPLAELRSALNGPHVTCGGKDR